MQEFINCLCHCFHYFRLTQVLQLNHILYKSILNILIFKFNQTVRSQHVVTKNFVARAIKPILKYPFHSLLILGLGQVK